MARRKPTPEDIEAEQAWNEAMAAWLMGEGDTYHAPRLEDYKRKANAKTEEDQADRS